MNGELYHNQRVKVEYDEASKPMKIQMNGESDAYYADLQEMSINPHIVEIQSLLIKKTGIIIDFTAPLVFDPNDRDLSGSLMRGVKVEGRDKGLFLENIEHLARNLGEEWERAVRKRKERIISRNNFTKKKK
jgi:hypothetical protein